VYGNKTRMDLFKRKIKEVSGGKGDGHKKDERVHATIGAMERGAVENMVLVCGWVGAACGRESKYVVEAFARTRSLSHPEEKGTDMYAHPRTTDKERKTAWTWGGGRGT
jgi:hypothetical protein